jgi:hypothetical protein
MRLVDQAIRPRVSAHPWRNRRDTKRFRPSILSRPQGSRLGRMTSSARRELRRTIIEILRWLRDPRSRTKGTSPLDWVPGGLIMQALNGNTLRFRFRAWGRGDARHALYATCRHLGRAGDVVFYPPTGASMWHVALPEDRRASDARYRQCLQDAANEAFVPRPGPNRMRLRRTPVAPKTTLP